MNTITGLHHVTVNSGDPQENVDFYINVLGMRLVKRTVNQDAPETYHFFFADGAGTPGTELTFFPWRGMPKGRPGTGSTSEVMLAVPAGSLEWWQERLAANGLRATRVRRFGEDALTFADPHGLALALAETSDARDFVPWNESPVPVSHQVRGLHAVRLTETAFEPTVQFLERGLGFRLLAEEDGWRRYAVADGGSGRFVDVLAVAGMARAVSGTGSVHHIAFRVPDDDAELAAQRRVFESGVRPTPVIDRFWFKSVYFREPGGALFEIATDGPGFTIDEDAATLGESLILAPFLEPHRAEIERVLPPITLRVAGVASPGGDA